MDLHSNRRQRILRPPDGVTMLDRLKRALPGSPLEWVRLGATLVAWALMAWTLVSFARPLLDKSDTIGAHDWDQQESYRYLVRKTILRFHQFPFWNPYSCGGHTGWGGFESDSTVVSPWLPFYLTMTLPHAMRVEVIGMTIISAAGAWVFAGRFTRSPAARALAAIVFAINGRWALQIRAGHAWHLSYALTPWALYFFDRAAGVDFSSGRARRRDVVLTGTCLATMVYMGGIYPLPQTIVVIALYGSFLAMLTRSWRPIAAALTAGLLSFGLSAPKLLPVFDTLRRFPRYVDSTESTSFELLVATLTSRDQDMFSHPAPVPEWGWHEWGMYVGWAVVIAIVAGCLFGRGPRAWAAKWAGLVVLLISFGSFAPLAPWPMLRHLPVFKSQHVPSRWMFPALLVLLVVVTAVVERALRRSGAWRAALELALLAPVAWVARDILHVGDQPLANAFPNPMPPLDDSLEPFHTEIHLPARMNYLPDWSPPSLPAEMANIGTIDCGTFPGLHNYYRGESGRTSGLGARGRSDPLY
ncbi:MAG TPA: hypothetical protein VKU41_04790, partial [Polyangiaceae bacterium]|nr:hypothetical protein [Polyangiaceae bacterium]